MISTERESTVYVRVPVFVEWGELSDVTDQQVAVTVQPDARPSGWVTVDLVTSSENPLWRGKPELVFLGGPVGGEKVADVVHDGDGDYQIWAAATTASEHLVARVGVWEVT